MPPKPAPTTPATTSPPGPKGVPILGVLPRIWHDPLRFFQEVANECGGLARVGIGRFTFYLLSDPDWIRYVFQDPQDNYWKGAGLSAARVVMGNGLATSEGPLWERQHRLIQPALSHQRTVGLIPELASTVEEMLGAWRQRARSGRCFDLATEMNRLTLRMICRTLFGTELGERQTDQVCRSVSVLNEYINYCAWRWLRMPESWPTPRNLRFRAALRTLDRVVIGAIERRRQARRGRDGDLLDHLLDARDETTGEGMSDQQVRDEVVTSFIAGHETPANGLSWILYLLAAHPLDCERLVAELDTIAIDALPGTAALGEIPFLECVIKESLRLYPPAWIVVRTPREDDTIAGYSVPAGATILISQYVLQRHPAYWEHPEAFVPERWAPENAATLPRGAYFPFGGGSRTCTGIVLAKAILRLVVAAVSRRYRLETVPGQRVTPQPLTTLRPRGGVLVRVTER